MYNNTPDYIFSRIYDFTAQLFISMCSYVIDVYAYSILHILYTLPYIFQYGTGLFLYNLYIVYIDPPA